MPLSVPTWYEKTCSDTKNASVEKRWALNWDKHTQQDSERHRSTIGVWKREHGSNRGSTEEGRQKEILTKPRYTHKSPDTTRLLSVFYRAALRWRNSMTGQFLQRKIWSLSTLPPLAPLSLLFSVYPTWYHSVTSGPGSFFHHPPISFFPVLAFLLALYIPPVMFHSSVSIHLHVALLIPSHLLSSALIPPVSLLALPELFPCGVPFPPTPLCFPHSSWFISSLLSVPFIHCAISLYHWLSFLHLAPLQLYFLWPAWVSVQLWVCLCFIPVNFIHLYPRAWHLHFCPVLYYFSFSLCFFVFLPWN